MSPIMSVERPNHERAFAERPEVYAAWFQLNGAIKAGMDLRRYELATLAAARRLRSSYCCLAHGSVLMQQFNEPVREIALDHKAAGLDEIDVAVMDLAAETSRARALGDGDHGRRPRRRSALLLLEDAGCAGRPTRCELPRPRSGAP
jgi:alkylhydroperoxidase family enzyme